MLIARTTTRQGHELLIVGLSKENRRRLEADQPIHLTTVNHDAAFAKDHELHLILFAGDTEATMQAQLSALIKDPITTDTPRRRR